MPRRARTSAKQSADPVQPSLPRTLGRFALGTTLLVLASCRSEEAANQTTNQVYEPPSTGQLVTYAGQGQDRLCLADGGARAGLISYGDGDTNCTVSGTAQQQSDRLTITPDGDETCRIEATLAGDRLTFGEVTPACAYYCGPSASFAGKSFTRTPSPQPATDLAGDPLC